MIALATAAAVPSEFDDDRLLATALAQRGAAAVSVVWDDPNVQWDRFHRVVIRSTWDYPRKREAFLAWADALDSRLENPPAVVHWNSDKHYLADLVAAGIPTVPTCFVNPDSEVPLLQGEVVVKPTISAGARDTGRFGPSTHDQARRLMSRLHSEGRTAMVQPYIPSVDVSGESALTFIAGRFSHAAHKRPVLRPDEVAPVRDDEIGGAEVMYDPDIVGPGTASEREIEVATDAVAYLRERFGVAPLYARVDLVAGRDGDPLLLELEAVEPNLFLRLSPGAATALAEEILER